jgi:hypothetical protein
MHTYAQAVGIFAIAIFIWYALFFWIIPAAKGSDKEFQWVELTRLVFLGCYVLGFFKPVSDHVMTMSFFGSLAPEMQTISLQLIEALKYLSLKSKERVSSVPQSEEPPL